MNILDIFKMLKGVMQAQRNGGNIKDQDQPGAHRSKMQPYELHRQAS